MPAEAVVAAERVGDAGQRQSAMLGAVRADDAEALAQHVPVRHVVRHLAQAVHVVGEGEQPRRHVGEAREGLTHHGRAHDLAEGADMRQARRPVAGLEQHMALVRRRAADAREQPARLVERPGARREGEVAFAGHGRTLWAGRHRVNARGRGGI